MRVHYFGGILVVTLFLVQHLAFAQQLDISQKPLSLSAKVDSAFTVNFASMEQKLIHKQYFTREEGAFIYVISFLSGIDPNDIGCYSPTVVNRERLREYKVWYQQHKEKIIWTKFARGIKLINSPVTDESSAGLDSLRIK